MTSDDPNLGTHYDGTWMSRQRRGRCDLEGTPAGSENYEKVDAAGAAEAAEAAGKSPMDCKRRKRPHGVAEKRMRTVTAQLAVNWADAN
jgi:hypothetical protein